LNNQFDYGQLECALGPAYYPAANVLLYAFIAYICPWSYACGQWFSLLGIVLMHSLSAALVTTLTPRSHQRLAAIAAVFCGHYVHHVAIAKLSNDTFAVVLVQAAIFCLVTRRLTACTGFITLAMLFKMNNLLYIPAFFTLYVVHYSVVTVLQQVGLALVLTLALSLPFLWTAPATYLAYAFSFSRKFTVSQNYVWRFLSDETLHSSWFALLLLLATATLDLLCCLAYARKYAQRAGGNSPTSKTHGNSNSDMLLLLLSVHAIGFTLSKGLHAQFVMWIYWSLPLLVPALLHLSFPLTVAGLILYDCCFRLPMIDVLRFGRYDLNNAQVLLILHGLLLWGIVSYWYRQYWKRKRKEETQSSWKSL
jgi:hypothetical protein